MGRLSATNGGTGSELVPTIFQRLAKFTDEKDLFTFYCRMPGSRCDRIMTMIEAGMSDYEIGLRYNEIPQTIAVYRKELEAYAGRADGARNAG